MGAGETNPGSPPDEHGAAGAHEPFVIPSLLTGNEPVPSEPQADAPSAPEKLWKPTHLLVQWLFLRGLAVVYGVAFVSLWVQVDGLLGSRGILPAAAYLQRARDALGAGASLKLPTLCWLSADDAALHALCAAGAVLSVLLLTGVAPTLVLAALWAAYLSLAVAGQTFLGFQWDALLLETGLLAIFVSPGGLRPRLTRARPPGRAGLWLMRWLLFKLMFLSGVTKLLSGDAAWRGLTALDVHYQTQPLPTWIGWWAHQLPPWLQAASCLVMFAIELGAPLLIFGPRVARLGAAAALLLLQALIAATGNYGFFNLLAALLCIWLVDDRLLRRLLPTRATRWVDRAAGRHDPRWRRVASWTLAAALLAVSGVVFLREMTRTARPDRLPAAVAGALGAVERAVVAPAQRLVLDHTDPWRSINGYGLFRVMTTERPQLVIEGSDDGDAWREYELPWQRADLSRRPRFVAPHMPRLDWQMWFAALSPRGSAHWLEPLTEHLLDGTPEVLELFAVNPFPDAPPRFVRLAVYRYEFTDPATRRQDGRWWKREPLGYATGAVSRETSSRRPSSAPP